MTDRSIANLPVPWPSLRESLRHVTHDLDRALSYLRTYLFDTRLDSSEQTLVAFQGRASQTVAEVDKLVAPVRAEVDELRQWIDGRKVHLHERIAGLSDAKSALEREPTPVTSVNVAACVLIGCVAIGVIVASSLGFSRTTCVVLGLLGPSVGAGAAIAADAQEFKKTSGRTVGMILSAIIAGVISVAMVETVDGPDRFQQGALDLLTVAATFAAFSVVFGVINTADERARRRRLRDARNGILAAETELRRFVPEEERLLAAAAVGLGELASNSCRIARELFVNRSEQLIVEATNANGSRDDLGAERGRLLNELDEKIQTHLENPGQPDNWSHHLIGSR